MKLSSKRLSQLDGTTGLVVADEVPNVKVKVVCHIAVAYMSMLQTINFEHLYNSVMPMKVSA